MKGIKYYTVLYWEEKLLDKLRRDRDVREAFYEGDKLVIEVVVDDDYSVKKDLPHERAFYGGRYIPVFDTGSYRGYLTEREDLGAKEIEFRFVKKVHYVVPAEEPGEVALRYGHAWSDYEIPDGKYTGRSERLSVPFEVYVKDGVLHREDGPAFEDCCERVWFRDGVKFKTECKRRSE